LTTADGGTSTTSVIGRCSDAYLAALDGQAAATARLVLLVVLRGGQCGRRLRRYAFSTTSAGWRQAEARAARLHGRLATWLIAEPSGSVRATSRLIATSRPLRRLRAAEFHATPPVRGGRFTRRAAHAGRWP
jgi:hypothetical protein